MIKGLKGLGIAVCTLSMTMGAAAADFPEEQITMIVPFPAGGGSDRVARTVDEFWTEATGQGFNFQYYEGAGGAVGTSRMAEAEPNGYTVGIVNLPDLVVQPLSGIATFSPDDFDYIGQVNFDPLVLMVPEDSPYESLEDFMAEAQDAPGTLTWAVSGTLGAGHLLALMMNDIAGAEVTPVPTQGGANTAARVAGGHVTAGSIGLGLFTTQDAGRALGVSSGERADLAPDIPTFREQGIDADLSISRIIVAPKGIPEEAKTYLRETLRTVVENEGFIEASQNQGLGAAWMDGDDLEQHVMDMEDRFRTLLEAHGQL